jgi:LPS-assembly protein
LVLGLAPAAAYPQQAGLGPQVESEHRGPFNVTGHTFVYDYKADKFIVTGDAVITQSKSVLTADQVEMLRRERVLHAKGNVHMVDPLGDIKASEATIHLNDETAELTNGKVTSDDKAYRLEGEKIRKLTGQHYGVLRGFFTTCGCEPGTPDWSITAKDMDVHLGETGVAHNAKFNILGYPVMFFPYIAFPTDTNRHSGLLSPRIGESGLRGFQIVQPYYWAINRSSDATVAVDYESSQRVGALAEYRLITGIDDYFVIDGAFYDESLRSSINRQQDIVDNQIADPHIPLDRYDVIGMLRQHITPNLVVYGDGMTVSDSLFLREMNAWTLSRTVGPGIAFPNSFSTMRNAVSDFGILDSYDNGFARLQGTWNQDLIQQQSFALQTMPEMLVSGRKELLGGRAYTDYDIQGTNFWRAAGQSGVRLDLSPRVTVPWRLGDYLYGFGRLGLRETVYDVSGRTINITPVGTAGLLYNNALSIGALGAGGLRTREMIYGSAGAGTEIEKVYDLNWPTIEKIKHTIDPFVTYSLMPQLNQKSLPLFDQVDRMEPRSLLTYGFTSRIYAKVPTAPATPGTEGGATDDSEQSRTINPFRAKTTTAGGAAVVELMRFSLLQAYDTAHAIAKGAGRFSDLDMTLTAFPTNFWSMGGQFGYSPREGQIHYASAYLNFQPWWTNNKSKLYLGKAEDGSFVQISYNYIGPGPTAAPGINAGFSQFIAMRAYYGLFDRMGVYFAPSYDFVTRKLLSSEYGVRVKSPCDCWAVDLGITKTINPSETQFQFQVTLGGIGSVGQSPFGRNPFQLRSSVLPNFR